MRFKRRGGRKGIRRPNRWTAQVIDADAVGTAAVYQVALVSRDDYQVNDALEPGGSGLILAGIRGYLTVAPTVATAFTLWMGIYCMDFDAAGGGGPGGSSDPSAFQNLIDERWLWHWSTRYAAAAAATPSSPWIIPVHVKTKVRLKDDNVNLCALVTNATAGNNLTLTGALRMNLRGITS